MDMRHNEDRELDIRLAELQADVQINLTICFGLFTGFIAVMTAYLQIYFTLPPESLLRLLVTISIVILGGACWVVVTIFMKKANDKRKQMEDLRKQYVG